MIVVIEAESFCHLNWILTLYFFSFFPGEGNITVSAEYNFCVDPEAARVVLEETAIPINLVPWEICYYDIHITPVSTVSASAVSVHNPYVSGKIYPLVGGRKELVLA